MNKINTECLNIMRWVSTIVTCMDQELTTIEATRPLISACFLCDFSYLANQTHAVCSKCLMKSVNGHSLSYTGWRRLYSNTKIIKLLVIFPASS